MNSTSTLHLIAPPSCEEARDSTLPACGSKGFLLAWLRTPGRLRDANTATSDAEARRLHPELERECAQRGLPGRYPFPRLRNAISQFRCRTRQGRRGYGKGAEYLQEFARQWSDPALPPNEDALELKEILDAQGEGYPLENIISAIVDARRTKASVSLRIIKDDPEPKAVAAPPTPDEKIEQLRRENEHLRALAARHVARTKRG